MDSNDDKNEALENEDNKLKIAQPDKHKNVIHILTLIVLAISVCVNVYLTYAQQQWQERMRKLSIAPNIQLCPGTGYSQSTDDFQIVFTNVGNGIAQDIWVFAASEGSSPGIVFYTFSSIDTAIKGKQKFIKPGEKLKISSYVGNFLGCDLVDSLKKKGELARTMIQRKITIFFSYFDSEDNEYLMAYKFYGGSLEGPIIAWKRESPLDTLIKEIDGGMKVWTRKMYDESALKIRSDERWTSDELSRKALNTIIDEQDSLKNPKATK